MSNPIVALAGAISSSARRRRALLFQKLFLLTPDTRILDLGTEGSAHIASVLEGTPVRPANVCVADIAVELVLPGAQRFGFTPVVVSESDALPFQDGEFDIVFCSSVIEHVSVSKEEVWRLTDARRFLRHTWRRQLVFAREIRRVGRGYLVQTPERSFPVESHTWLPLVGFLPRPLLVRTLRFTNRYWVKQTEPDWHLLGAGELARLFPEAQILRESCLGLTKSLMAFRLNDPRPTLARTAKPESARS